MTFKDGEFTLWASEIYEDETSTINIIFRVRANTSPAMVAAKKNLSIIGLRHADAEEMMVWLKEHPNLKPIT
jgi:hypothetical protein